MKCGPPEQAVIPSIAHSGRKVKGRGRAPAGRAAFAFPGLSGAARAGRVPGAGPGSRDMPGPACLPVVTVGRPVGDGPVTDDRYCLGTFGYKSKSNTVLGV